jgi:hypothetical protein
LYNFKIVWIIIYFLSTILPFLVSISKLSKDLYTLLSKILVDRILFLFYIIKIYSITNNKFNYFHYFHFLKTNTNINIWKNNIHNFFKFF